MSRQTMPDESLRPEATAEPPPAVLLALGPEELLAERAAARVIASARAVDPEADVHDLQPAMVAPGTLAGLTSPSLFANHAVVIIRNVHDLTSAGSDEVISYLAAPAPTVSLVLMHRGSAKGKALLAAAREAGAVEVDCGEIKRYADKLAFVRAEVRAAGRQITDGAARALLDAVGADLRSLASACSQLTSDTSGTIDEATVRQYYAGRAEVTSFMVADHAVEGRVGEALAHLRWALGSGVDPVLVTAALAMALRNLARLGEASRTRSPAEVGRALGLPSWKLDRLRHQLRGWSPTGVAVALRAVADADAAVKGAGTSAEYALEKAIVSIARARGLH